MTWTLQFYAEQETIGTLVALLDGQSVYKESVNLDDDKGINEFIEKAKKLATEPALPSKADALLVNITTKFNS